MKIRDLLASATGIPRLDAELLLAHVLGKNRSWLLAHADDECREVAAFDSLAARRRGGEPVAHLTGTREFFGRAFSVTKDTLIPRPATETLVTETLRFLKEGRGVMTDADTDISVLSLPLHAGKTEIIVDIGTGTGCIAVTLGKEGWAGGLIGVDTSEAALKVAKENAKAYGVRMDFVHADGAEFLASMKRPFLVVSNPPYIPDSAETGEGVRKYEPLSALFAGERGLDVLLPLARAAAKHPLCTGIILELRTDQVKQVKAEIQSAMLGS